MTTPTAEDGNLVELASLTPLRPIATGGSGSIHQPADRPEVVYKEFRDAESYRSRTRELVEFRTNLSRPHRESVDATFSWPLAQVVNNGQFVGILLSRIPFDFYVHLSTGTSKERNLGYLIHEKRSERVGILAVPLPGKLAVLRSLARACQFLDKFDLVHEDLSPRNIAWTLDEAPAVYLLDCDSIRSPSENPSPPAFLTPEWTDPRVLGRDVARPDKDSTVYSLGLIAARVLIDPSWRPPLADSDDDKAQDPMLRLISRSVRASLPRPAIDEWIETLTLEIERTPSTPTASRRVDVATTAPARVQFNRVSYQDKDRIAVGVGVLLGILAAILVLLLVSGP